MQDAANTLGLYLSVPFCRAKCSFCNFASGVGSVEAVEGYVALLCGEIQDARRAAQAAGVALPQQVDSVYFGGGTPSLLKPAQLRRIMRAIRAEFAFAAESEITMEAAPGQIGAEVLEAALTCGINRVSLGVQSFTDREAQAVGRSHSEASCRAEFARLRRAGVANLGADLIAGLPYQTESSWEHTLNVAVESDLEHVSVYMLEVDEESRLGREVLGGGARLHAPAVPSDDLTAALYERACDRLPAAGFAQYEISNFAVEGRRSQHNLKYWLRRPYLGFGLDAHSMLTTLEGGVLRWANPDSLDKYDGLPQIERAATATSREAFEESVFLGLRLSDGMAWSALGGYPVSWLEELGEAAAMLEREGLLRDVGGQLSLTQRGRMVSSEVFGELLAGVPV